MKKHYIKILLLLIYSNLINGQCTISSFSVQFAADVTGGCSPLNPNFVNFSNYGTSPTDVVTSTWDFGNGSVTTQTNLASSSAANVSTTYSNTGTYTVSLNLMVTSPTSTCIGSRIKNNYITVYCTVNTNEYFNEKNILVYPNPSSGNFTLEMNNEIENGKIIIFNSLGQKVYEEKILEGKNSIGTSTLMKGIYYFTIFQNEKWTTSRKLIIE